VDSGWEDIHENITQDIALTKEINTVDEELELLEMKKQNFMNQWEMEHDRILQKREQVAAKREDVRKKFRRLSRNVGDQE
jgi:uncharacterized protein (DUF3084 family)